MLQGTRNPNKSVIHAHNSGEHRIRIGVGDPGASFDNRGPDVKIGRIALPQFSDQRLGEPAAEPLSMVRNGLVRERHHYNRRGNLSVRWN